MSVYVTRISLASYWCVTGFLVGGIGGFGVTGGVHRYFTHRSFKANLPLQIILIACYTVSGQVRLHAIVGKIT